MTDIVEQPVSTSHLRTEAGAGGRGAVSEAPMNPKNEGGWRRTSSASESADTLTHDPKSSSQSEVGMSRSTSDVGGSSTTEIGQTVIECSAAIATNTDTGEFEGDKGMLATERGTEHGKESETETDRDAPLIALPPWEG